MRKFVNDREIKYMDVWTWFDEVPARREAYDKAIAVQGEVHRDIVTGGLVSAATFDVADLLDDYGDPKKISKISPEARANIQGIEVTTNDKGYTTTKIRMTDKTKNRELLGKRHGMFVDKIEHGGTLTLEQMVSASLVKPEGPVKTG